MSLSPLPTPLSTREVSTYAAGDLLSPGADLKNPALDPLAHLTEQVVGRFAVCSIGYIGRITGRDFVTYPDGRSAWAWVGRSARDIPWSSTRPRLLQRDDEALLATHWLTEADLSARGAMS
jgi:hypothetical protein